MQEYENRHTGKKYIQHPAKDEMANYDGKMMIIEMDKEGTITYSNKKFREMTGYDKEELIGLPFSVSQHPDVPDGICQQAFELASEGKIWAGYIKSITRTGEYFWTAVCVQPKYDMEKKLVGYVINKKAAEREMTKGVEREYDRYRQSPSSDFKSEYCGELHTIQN